MAENSDYNRANWSDPIQRKLFLDLCLLEANNGNRSGGSLKPAAWNRIGIELQKFNGKLLTQKHLKNGWDYTRKQYLAWLKLTTTTGHGYNSETGTIDWPHERWEEYLQRHPKAKQFRYRPLANLDVLGPLFDGVLATGTHSWSTNMEAPLNVRTENTASSTTKTSETPIDVEDESIEKESESNEKQSRERRKKKRKVDEIQEELNRILNVLESEDKTVIESVAILRKLLSVEDPLYFVAANALCTRKEFRVFWLSMESDKERIGWIKSLPKS